MKSKREVQSLSEVMHRAIEDAQYFEEQIAASSEGFEGIDDRMHNAIEDCYTTAAVAQKLSEWIALHPGDIEGDAMLIVTLCTEVAAAVRKEASLGIHATIMNQEGARTWH